MFIITIISKKSESISLKCSQRGLCDSAKNLMWRPLLGRLSLEDLLILQLLEFSSSHRADDFSWGKYLGKKNKKTFVINLWFQLCNHQIVLRTQCHFPRCDENCSLWPSWGSGLGDWASHPKLGKKRQLRAGNRGRVASEMPVTWRGCCFISGFNKERSGNTIIWTGEWQHALKSNVLSFFLAFRACDSQNFLISGTEGSAFEDGYFS